MSRRARRQQAELEELSTAAPAVDASGSHDSDGDDDVELPQATSSRSAFAALSGAGEIQEPESEDDDQAAEASTPATGSRSKKKKRKKPKQPQEAANGVEAGGDPQAAEAANNATTPTTPSKKPKKPSKKVAKAQTPVSTEDDGLDEIDRALRELGQKPSESSGSGPISSSAPVVTARIRSLLAVDPKNLDADAELRKFFGAKVVQSAAASQQQVRGARANNPHHALNRQFRQGGTLAKPQPNWPPAAFAKSGLEMTLVESGNGESLWTFEHSRGYVEVTQMYLEAVASLDPNQLMAILHVHPYHTETLMGLSDMAAQQGDPGMSQDFLDRALYAYERAFAPNFNIQNGNVRLDFRRIESRGFFRGIEKRTSSLMRRGTWRTLFEHTKLLYSLSPFDDPYGALLFLDFTAPKAKQHSWFIDFLAELPRTLSQTGHATHLQIDSYPGLWYAKALCQWHIEEAAKQSHDDSTKSLQQAILRYPLTVAILISKLDRNPPADIAKLDNAQPESGFTKRPSYILQLLSQLYVHRSETLWREPEVLDWLMEVARSTASIFSKYPGHSDVAFGRDIWQTNRYGANDAVPEGIYRHVLVSDIQPIRLYLPKSVLNSLGNVYDPLPPGPGFDDDYFRAMYEGGRRPAPTGAARGSASAQQGLMQRLMQALQAGGGAGAGGDIDPETQAAIFAQFEQIAAERGGVRMPGNLGGGNDAAEDSEEEEAEEAAFQTQASTGGLFDFIRGMMRPATAPQPENDSESDEESR